MKAVEVSLPADSLVSSRNPAGQSAQHVLQSNGSCRD